MYKSKKIMLFIALSLLKGILWLVYCFFEMTDIRDLKRLLEISRRNFTYSTTLILRNDIFL